MVSSNIKKQRQHYLEYIYANNRTIEQINPAVKKIDVEYTIHWYELPSSQACHHLTLLPDCSIIIHEWCPNEDCERNGFNLSGLLSTMLVQNQTEQTGTLRCDQCSASLDYLIKIEYKQQDFGALVVADDQIKYPQLAKNLSKARSTIQIYVQYLEDNHYVKRHGNNRDVRWDIENI